MNKFIFQKKKKVCEYLIWKTFASNSNLIFYYNIRAPADCRQYFTGVSGTFSSYNYAGAQMLQTQQYTDCFRQEQGMHKSWSR